METKTWREGDLFPTPKDLARESCLVDPRPLSAENFEVVTENTSGKRKDGGL